MNGSFPTKLYSIFGLAAIDVQEIDFILLYETYHTAFIDLLKYFVFNLFLFFIWVASLWKHVKML